MTTKQFRLMLAGKADLLQVIYPIAATPKIDGIRCFIKDGLAVSRTLKPIRNKNVQQVLQGLPSLDGELICANGTFQESTSLVMSESGGSGWEFHVFDYIADFENIPGYADRILQLKELAETTKLPKEIKLVLPTYVYEKSELLEIHRQHLADGYEGTMIRTPSGPYKMGRSTTKEGSLLKLKQFEDFEAKIIGFEEMLHNENAATVNALGLTERSSHKDNKVASGVLGAFVVEHSDHPGMVFKVGTGLTANQRKEFWQRQNALLGQLIKVRAMSYGVKELPRHPSFLGFRHLDDL